MFRIYIAGILKFIFFGMVNAHLLLKLGTIVEVPANSRIVGESFLQK